MTDEYTYPMRDGAPTGSPSQYDLASIVRYLRSSDPAAVTRAGQAYLKLGKAYERITAKLAQAGHDLNEAWSGTDASLAQERLRDLWAASHTISAASRDFGTAVERHGSEYLAWYRNSMPQPKDDAEARSWMQGANERITETWSAFPSSISTALKTSDLEHGGLISPAPSGGSGGSGVPGGMGGSGASRGLAGPGSSSSTLAGTPSTGGPRGDHHSVVTTPTPGGATPGGLTGHTGQPPGLPSVRRPDPAAGSPGSGQGGNHGTDLSGIQRPGAGNPNSGDPGLTTEPSSVPASPLTGPHGPGAGGSTPSLPTGGKFGFPHPGEANLPGGAAIGLPKGGFPMSPEGGGGSGTGNVSENGRIRNGVIGRGRIGPAPSAQAAFEEAATTRSGPMTMGPMTGSGGSAQRNRERERRSWVGEDRTLWEEDIEASPRVLGATPEPPPERGGRKS